jgi:DNA-binding NtrC family response regulator
MQVNSANNTITRKALMVDEDKDRYRRKERNDLLKQAGFKVYPVLRMQDVCTRCKPGAFELIVVNGTENPEAAVQLCEQIKANDPKQKIVLVSDQNHDRDYVVSNWDELKRRITSEAEPKKDLVAA